MNWSRVKSLLILLFTLINIFLLTLFIVNEHRITVKRQETVEKAVAVLAYNDIYISQETVPAPCALDGRLRMLNLAADPRALAHGFLGENYQEQSESGKYVFVNGSACLTVEDYHLLYSNSIQDNRDVSQKRVRYLTRCVMEQLGVKGEHFVIAQVEINGNNSRVKVKPRYKKLSVRGTFLTLAFRGESLIECSGSFLTPVNVHEQKTDSMLEPSAVLMDLIANADIQRGCTILRMEQCYYLRPEELSAKRTEATAVYVITDNRNRDYIYDARSGEYLGMYEC